MAQLVEALDLGSRGCEFESRSRYRFMKKSILVSGKCHAHTGWNKHLERDDQRRAWKSNRRITKAEIKKNVDEIQAEEVDRLFSALT